MKQKHISLCLWWWGARGFIHIGVLRYLEEEGYTVEEISGNSMGAVIAAAFAMGNSSSQIHEFVRKEYSIFSLLDFSFGKGLISGNKICKSFSKIYGETKVESTKIPLKIVATNLTKSEKAVFISGSILDAVRASMSVPGMFTPHEIAGESYVDGMLVSNLPVEELEGDNVLAVSTALTPQFTHKSAKQIMTKSFNIALLRNEEISLNTPRKDITLIRPEYDEIDFIDFHKYDKIIEIGYEAAKQVLG